MISLAKIANPMSEHRQHHPLDRLITGVDKALRVIAGVASAARPSPAHGAPDADMDSAEQRHSAGLMRVNHVGEVCAQALYNSQALFAKSDALRRQFEHAGRDEEDHLAWTAERLTQLGARPSLLNPLWYGGAYALGTAAAFLGDARSLGFVVETERQVEAHLASHLLKLPQQDAKSRAIVEQMRSDEAEHGAAAEQLGATATPALVKVVMTLMSKVMTGAAYRI
ncbi:MAG: ubiquinone biosynthesis monooxygenase Coq7 [Janthinobacterium sp.]|jgi:ubiquinone biosynthesis monooxygenase Coq7